MGGSRHGPVADPDDVAGAVAAALKQVPRHDRVVLAVSGGPDSLVMASLVRRVRPDLQATIAHVRHGLRPDDADAAAAAALADGLEVTYAEATVDTADGTGGVEARARRARYGVLVAHTADDQAETVLINISRGTGASGLTMPARRPLGDATLLRPLLGVRRAAVRALADRLAAAGVPVVSDPMNADPRFRRTRARLHALPALGALSGGGTDPVEALLRLTQALEEDTAALQQIAAAASARIVARWGPVRAVAWQELAALPAAVAARVVREELRDTDGGYPPPRRAVRAVLELGEGDRVSLPGGATASRRGRWLILAPTHLAPLKPRSLGEPLPELGVTVVVDRAPRAGLLPFWAPPTGAPVVPVPTSRLTVRAADRHERIETVGGPRRLWSALRAVVPEPARPLVVVVADDHGAVWVPGVAVRAGLTDVGHGFARLAASGAGADRG